MKETPTYSGQGHPQKLGTLEIAKSKWQSKMLRNGGDGSGRGGEKPKRDGVKFDKRGAKNADEEKR